METHTVAELGVEPPLGLEGLVHRERRRMASRPKRLRATGHIPPGRSKAERESSARGAWHNADGARCAPLLVAAVLVRDERPHRALDGQRSGAVSDAGAQFNARPRLRIPAVVTKPHLPSRSERRPVACLEDALAFEDESQPRHVALGALETLRAVGLGAHPHGVGLHIQADAARTGAVEHRALHPDRAHVHRKVGVDSRPALLVQGELSAADTRESPHRDPLAHLEPCVGVDAGEGALDRATVIAQVSVQRVGALAPALREQQTCQHPVPLGRRTR